MPYLVDVSLSFPKNYYSQKEIVERITSCWNEKVNNIKRIEMIHENVLVEGRHLALEVEKYFEFKNFDEKNNYFIQNAVDLSVESIEKILKKYDLGPKDISALWSNTITGFSIPSLEARVMNRVDFSPNTKRVPLLGLGCMAGVAGINRVGDYLKAYPDEAVIFFSVELCSLTVQFDDISVANFISTGLFGDGGAAVLMVGDNHPLKKIAPLKWHNSESLFFPNTEDVMGWNVGEKGLKIILSKSVPDVTKDNVPGPLKNYLKRNQMKLDEIQSFFAHPGGPKVLLALEEVLGLKEKGLYHSWESLRENGNMSSVSVLDILSRNLRENEKVKKHGKALSLAMGPAFSSEFGLFEWQN